MLNERKRRVRLREQSQGFGLSFVDLVSGGFGAAFFLFLIFASLPVDSPAVSASGGARFLEVQLIWEAGPRRVEIYLEIDGATQPIRLSSGSFEVDSETGILNWTGEGPRPFWRTGTTSGFTWFGNGAMEEFGQDASNVVRFRLIDPCGAMIRIGASIHGTTQGIDWLKPTAPPPVNASLHATISDGNSSPEVYEAEIELTDSVAYPAQLKLDGQAVDGVIEVAPFDFDAAWCG
ncbi:MAG: hypothetical protein P1U83_18450 [Roseovarius sp.]|nr:hypothetical protein [Roseovarius sp.]